MQQREAESGVGGEDERNDFGEHLAQIAPLRMTAHSSIAEFVS